MKELKEFDTLDEAQQYPVYSVLDAGKVRGRMMKAGLYSWFKQVDNDAKALLIDQLASGGGLDLDPNTEDGAGNLEIYTMLHESADAETKTKLENFLAYCNHAAISHPYAASTPEEFEFNKRLTGETSVSEAAQSKNLIITVNESLTQSVCIVFWGVKEGYADVNLGKHIHVKEQKKYIAKTAAFSEYDEIKAVARCSNLNFTLSY